MIILHLAKSFKTLQISVRGVFFKGLVDRLLLQFVK